MRSIFFVLLLLILTLAACSSHAIAPTVSGNQTNIIVPTETNLPTSTPTQQISILNTPTATTTPNPRFTQLCLPISDKEFDLGELALGTILFPATTWNDLTLRDLQTGNEYKLPLQRSKSLLFLGFAISPNRQMIAQLAFVYDEQGNKVRTDLWIFDAQANVRAKREIGRTDLVWLYWLDNERLILYTETYGHHLLVNPFNAKYQVLSDELPNIYQGYKPGIWWPVVYSPDLQWVTYVSDRIENGDYIEGPVVYNLVNKKTLWGAANRVGSDAAWSPDGQELAFTGGMNEYQFYLFNRSGLVKTLLNENLPHRAFTFSWSPDSRYIAFWNAESLMLYDRQKDRVIDLCIQGNGSYPDWSPDSKQLIVWAKIDSGLGQILIDWPQKTAYKIKQISKWAGFGWMISTP